MRRGKVTGKEEERGQNGQDRGTGGHEEMRT